MKKAAFFILMALSIIGCGDNKTDFEYNQKVTKEFIKNRDNVNQFHKDIEDGAYNHSSDPSKHFSEQSVVKIEQDLKKSTEVVNKAPHSVAADVFHKEILAYFSVLNDTYYPKAKEFINAEEGDLKQKKLQELNSLKTTLDQKEQEVLDAKVLFLKQVNIEE